jgi:hypothetical protein
MRRQRLRFADVRLDDGWQSEMAPRYRRLAGALSWPLRLLSPTFTDSGVISACTRTLFGKRVSKLF